MTATEILKHEHQIIIMVLSGARREILSIQDSGKINAEKIDKIVDFCQNFIERCHHAKEEEYLLVKMQERGLSSDREPISVMLKEHREGGGMVKAIAEAFPQARTGDASAIASVSLNLRAYVGLLQDYINKENNVFFPLADQLFTAGSTGTAPGLRKA
jgi:hemerythrin-like domain-containing protein